MLMPLVNAIGLKVHKSTALCGSELFPTPAAIVLMPENGPIRWLMSWLKSLWQEPTLSIRKIRFAAVCFLVLTTIWIGCFLTNYLLDKRAGAMSAFITFATAVVIPVSFYVCAQLRIDHWKKAETLVVESSLAYATLILLGIGCIAFIGFSHKVFHSKVTQQQALEDGGVVPVNVPYPLDEGMELLCLVFGPALTTLLSLELMSLSVTPPPAALRKK